MLTPSYLLRISVLVVLVSCEQSEPVVPSEVEKPVVEFTVEEGAGIVLLGDSIVQQCQFSQMLETHFYQRYGTRKVSVRNAGLNGDKVGGALERFDQEVAAHDPSWVFVHFGMNDGGYQKFSESTFHQYQSHMATLLGRIRELGAEPVVLGLTPFEAELVKATFPDLPPEWGDFTDYDSVLVRYEEWLRAYCAGEGVRFIPLHEAMAGIPGVTVDGIHPSAEGHLLMVNAVLDGLGEADLLVTLHRDESGQWVGSETLESLRGGDDEVMFRYRPSRLPTVLAGGKLVRGATRLVIQGLDEGKYDVSVNGSEIGQWRAATLSEGIDLDTSPQSKWRTQASEIANLNEARNRDLVAPLRYARFLGSTASEEEIGAYEVAVSVAEKEILKGTIPEELFLRIVKIGD